MYRAEDRHFWFVAKRRLLNDLLLHELNSMGKPRILDVGCGTGSLLASLSGYSTGVGIDPDAIAMEFCRRRGLKLLARGVIENLGLASDSFDAVLSSDVIEHLDNDLAAVKEIYRVLAPEGFAIITVPAIPWLWSSHDLALGHKRRYTRRSLKRLLFDAGFKEIKVVSFMSATAPMVILVRLFRKLAGISNSGETMTYDIPYPVNRLLLWVLDIERRLVIGGFDLFIGTTLVAIVRKPME